MAWSYSTGVLTSTGASSATPDLLSAGVAVVQAADAARGYVSGNLGWLSNVFVQNSGSSWIVLDANFTLELKAASAMRPQGGGFEMRQQSVLIFNLSSARTDADPFTTGSSFVCLRAANGVSPKILHTSSVRVDFPTVPTGTTPALINIQGLDVVRFGSGNIFFKSYFGQATTVTAASFIRLFGGVRYQFFNTTHNDSYLESLAFESETTLNTVQLNRPTFYLATPVAMSGAMRRCQLSMLNPSFLNNCWNGSIALGDDFSGSLAADSSLSINYSFSHLIKFGLTAITANIRYIRSRESVQNSPSWSSPANATIDASASTSSVTLLDTYRLGAQLTAIERFNWTAKVRAYNYKTAGETIFANRVLYQHSVNMSAGYIEEVQVLAVPFLTLSQAAASALTGLALTASGATGGTLAISGTRTPIDCWHFYRQWIATFANFGSSDTWDYDPALLDIAGWAVSISGAFTGNLKSLNATTITGAIATTGSQFGGTIASNSSLTLAGCTFAPGTTINTSAGAIVITVDLAQIANITAGSNVTIRQTPVTLTAPNLTSAAFDRVQCRVSLAPGGPIVYNNSTGARVSGGNLFVSGDVNLTTNTITISGVNGKITTNSPIRVGGSDLPVPLDPRAVYYPAGSYTSGNAIPLSGTPGGSTIDLIDTGTGSDRWLEIWTELATPLITSGSLSVDITGSASAAGVSLSNGDFVVLQAAHWKGNPQSQVPCTASEYFQQVFQYAGTNLSTLDSLVSADLHNQFCVIRGQDGSQVTDFILDSSAPGKIQLDTGVVAFSTYDAALYFYFVRSTVAGLRLLRNNIQILGLNEIRVIGEMTIEAQVRAVGSGAFTYRADGKFISADESQQIDWLWSGTVGIPVRVEVPVDLSQDVMNTLAAIASAVAVPSTGSGLDAAGVRSAIGLASANLDTQLDNLPTVSELNARTLPSADLTAIKTQTDKFVFTTTGRVDAGVIDKTGFSLTQTFPTNFASLAITGGGAVTAGTVSDKAGYSLSSSQSFNLTGNITGNLSGSVGSVTGAVILPALPTDWISAAGVSAAAVTKIQNGLSTYAGGDTSGTTTLLSRLTNTRAGLLDNLDATISSRSTYSGGDTPGTATLLSRITGAPLLASNYTAPNNAGITAIQTKTDQMVFTTANRLDSTAIGVPTNPLLTNDLRLNNLDATISSRMATFTYTAPPTVSQIWTGFTSGTVASNLITQFQSGLFQTSGYTAPNNAGILSAISALPQDKTGYSLSSSQTFNLTGNISGSVGSVAGAITLPALPTDWISAVSISAAAVTKIQSGLSTYSGGDTAGTSTLLTRLTSTRAGYLDNLAIYTAPDNAGITSIQNVLAAIQGSGFSTSTDSLKVLSDNLDTKPTAANVRTELATDFSNLEAIIFAS